MANEYFSRTPSIAGNRRTFTFSCWFKRIKIGTGGGNRNDIFTAGDTASVGAGGFHFWFIDDQLRMESDGGSIKVISNAAYRDISKPYHLVCRVDTTQSSASNRLRMYVNGNLVSVQSDAQQPSQNYQYQVNNTTAHYIGVGIDAGTLSYYAGGVMSDAFFVDGQSLDPSSFGKTNSNGQWIPKHPTGIKTAITSSGGFGTNGFYLPFGSNIGYDQSGLGNNYSANNFDLTGDFASKDTISNNFATLNRLLYGGSQFTITKGGVYAVSQSSGDALALSTIGVRSGKWYFEVKMQNGNPAGIGIHGSSTGAFTEASLNQSIGQGSPTYAINNAAGLRSNGTNTTTLFSAFAQNDIVACAYDLDNGKVWFSKNGTWSGDPSAGTGAAYTGITTGVDYFAAVGDDWGSASSESESNFGQGTFVTSNSNNGYSDSNGKGKFQYQPPTGFLALCEDNIADPVGASASPQSYFKAITWTGNGSSSRAITGLNFRPDFVWAKSRDTSFQHMLIDSVRGPNRVLHSNSTSTEDVNFQYGYFTSFDSNGFTMQAGSTSIENLNQNGTNYVGWAWKASNTTTSNTSGTITSTVSVNQTAGFSIVKYTGNGSSSATVGHGLGVTPKFILLKAIDSAYFWRVYHTTFGTSPTQGLLMGPADGTGNTAAYNHDSAGGIGGVNSNTFSFASSSWGGQAVNASGTNYIAYCWSEVPGYSKMGSYQYNNSSEGTFVYCGFKPAFVLIKNTDNVEQWYMVDNARNTYNGTQTAFMQVTSTTESNANSQATDSRIDFLSNGFKLRDVGSTGGGEVTFGNRNYIYLAFADSHFDFNNPT